MPPTLLDLGATHRDPPGVARIMSRDTTYRGRKGVTLYGSDALGRHVRIFTETRESADRIRAKLKAGQEITSADFMPPTRGDAPVNTTTATPWRIVSRGGNYDLMSGDRFPNERTVATVYALDAEDDATARLIVAAVNAYQPLRDALRHILAIHDAEAYDGQARDAMACVARQALTMADVALTAKETDRD